jgi:8-oxo-dGTP pyrophosphatase MutT (NUDIX family)
MNKAQLTKFRVAIYGVLVENGKVLLTETRVPSGVIVNFPGGGLELGEAPEEALAREFMEETRLHVEVGDLLFASRRFHQNPDYPTEQLMHLYYRVRRTGGTLLTTGNEDDVAGILWCSPNELPKERIQPVDTEFVAHSSFTRLFPSAA